MINYDDDLEMLLKQLSLKVCKGFFYEKVANHITSTPQAYYKIVKILGKKVAPTTTVFKKRERDIAEGMKELGIRTLSSKDIIEILKCCFVNMPLPLLNTKGIQKKIVASRIEICDCLPDIVLYIAELYSSLKNGTYVNDFADEDDDIIHVSDIEERKLPSIDYYSDSQFESAKEQKNERVVFLKNKKWSFVDREKELVLREETLSYWGNIYIYGKDAVNSCTSQGIKSTYKKIRTDFFKGLYYDLNNYSAINYAYVLMYDLLGSYSFHKDFSQLENQLHTLGKCCNKVLTHVAKELIVIARRKKIDDCCASKDGITIKQLFSYYPNSPEWRWNERCVFGYGIEKEDTKYLKFIYDFPFLRGKIDFFDFNKVLYNFYVDVVKECIDRYYGREEEFEQRLLQLKEYHLTSSYTIGKKLITFLYFKIFLLCKKEIFLHWGISLEDCDTTFQVRSVFLSKYNSLLLVKQLRKIAGEKAVELEDIPRNIELRINGEYYPTRWKKKYAIILEEYQQGNDLQKYIAEIKELADRNSENSNVKLLYYEVVRTLYATRPMVALSFYLKYVQANTQSRGNEKALPKYMLKELFSTSEEQTKFERILKQYKKNFNLDAANKAIEEIYHPKPKKFRIDLTSVAKSEKEYINTVNLLNTVLNDDDEEVLQGDEEIDIVDTKPQNQEADLDSDGAEVLTPVQNQLLQFFVVNDYQLSTEQIAKYAKSNGCFANQLINGINEQIFEAIDDNLIEEVECGWEMNKEYYKML